MTWKAAETEDHYKTQDVTSTIQNTGRDVCRPQYQDDTDHWPMKHADSNIHWVLADIWIPLGSALDTAALGIEIGSRVPILSKF